MTDIRRDLTSIICVPCARRLIARSQRGFTLIELMIAVAVIGILTSIALPSFEGQLHKARRADVLVTTMQVHLAEERYRSNASTYGSLAQIGIAAATSAGHYTLQLSSFDAEGFELLATATGSQARDSACRYMKFSSVGMNPVYASGPDADVSNAAGTNRRCWNI